MAEKFIRPIPYAIVCLVFLFLYLQYVIKIFRRPHLTIKPIKSTLFVAICSSNSTQKRVFNLMDSWGEDFKNNQYYGGIKILTTYITNVPVIKENMLYVPPGTICPMPDMKDKLYGKTSYIFAQYFVYACQYFLRETTASFMVRIVDDTYIEIDNIHFLFEEFEKANITHETPLFLGNCMDERNYLQGGSGYLVSRKTAQLIADRGVEWIQTMNDVEDRDIRRLIQWSNLTMGQASSPYFIGHLTPRFTATPYSKYKKCKPISEITYLERCSFRYIPLNHIIFWHDDIKVLNHRSFKKFIQGFPSTLSYYPEPKNRDYPKFCHSEV